MWCLIMRILDKIRPTSVAYSIAALHCWMGETTGLGTIKGSWLDLLLLPYYTALDLW